MRRRIGAMLAAAGLAAVAAIAVPAPAQAAPSCKAGYICLWDEQNYQGEMKELQVLNCRMLVLDGFNNRTESVVNNLGKHVLLADEWLCTGDAFLVLNGQALPSLGFMNNRVSGVGM